MALIEFLDTAFDKTRKTKNAFLNTENDTKELRATLLDLKLKYEALQSRAIISQQDAADMRTRFDECNKELVESKVSPKLI